MHNYFGEIIDFDSCWYYWCRDIVFVKKRCQTWLYSSSLWMCRKIFFLRLAEDVTSTHFARGISQKFGAIFRFIGSVWAYEGCFVVRLLQNNICDSPCSNYMWMHFWVLMHPFLFMMASCLSWPIAINVQAMTKYIIRFVNFFRNDSILQQACLKNRKLWWKWQSWIHRIIIMTYSEGYIPRFVCFNSNITKAGCMTFNDF